MRSVISETRESKPRGPKKDDGMEKPKRARKRKPETAKADLKPRSRVSSEGRVSIVRWNPKGMR